MKNNPNQENLTNVISITTTNNTLLSQVNYIGLQEIKKHRLNQRSVRLTQPLARYQPKEPLACVSTSLARTSGRSSPSSEKPISSRLDPPPPCLVRPQRRLQSSMVRQPRSGGRRIGAPMYSAATQRAQGRKVLQPAHLPAAHDGSSCSRRRVPRPQVYFRLYLL